MGVATLNKRSKHKDKGQTYKTGPLYNDQEVPYDYIVIIDAGSSGSRVYVYNWLNPLVGLEKGIDFNKLGSGLIRLVKRIDVDVSNKDSTTTESESNNDEGDLYKVDTEIQSTSPESLKGDQEKEEESDTETDAETDNDTDTESETEENDDHDEGTSNDKGTDDESKGDPEKQVDEEYSSKKKHKNGKGKLSKHGNGVRLPVVKNGKKWHKKIRPGISSFNASPRKIGNHHLKGLLTVAASIVPKSQHYRTPVFLHSTAGMRLLNPTEQQTILDTICVYLKSNSDFFVPECSSHINVITGDFEGIFGWLSINSLVGSFDTPDQHNHGKNHTTYGLLDMGGASTQVVFSPNSTEIEEHQNNLYKIKLSQVATLDNSSFTSYDAPVPLEFDLYSDSFLGFGMFQAHNRYLSFLVDEYRKEHKMEQDDKYYNTIGAPVPDPCLPRGYVSSEIIKDYKVDFTGESNFKQCLNDIFPVLSNSTYSGNYRCKQIDEPEVSSCLLNDLIPAFDFDINHFFGVSGYWDAINGLLAYDDKLSKRKKKKKGKHRNKENADNSNLKDAEANTYDYKVIYEKTSKLCGQSWSQLLEMNNKKEEKSQLNQDDLSELCFKASWILNFLHVGLGFPRFGIDEDTSHEKLKFENLQLVESLGGSQFSWTLGRAILYANDEYVQAYNNYTRVLSEANKQTNSDDITPIRRPGFYHSASSNVFYFGAEQQNVPTRPPFIKPDPNAKYKYYDYELGVLGNDSELKWYIEPHRWYGIFILLFMMIFIFWLMLGKTGRNTLKEKTKHFTGKVLVKFNRLVGSVTGKTPITGMSYFPVATSSQFVVGGEDLEGGLELATITKNSNPSTDSQFTIDSE